MRAFDLDGVFIPDLVFENKQLKDVLRFRSFNIQPTFEPRGEYYIITGRPNQDYKDTSDWINRFFTNKPIQLFHSNTDFQNAADYKVSVLNATTEIDIYIESDIIQVEYIKKQFNEKSESDSLF